MSFARKVKTSMLRGKKGPRFVLVVGWLVGRWLVFFLFRSEVEGAPNTVTSPWRNLCDARPAIKPGSRFSTDKNVRATRRGAGQLLIQ